MHGVFYLVVSFSSRHFGISGLSFRIPLNRMVLPVLKFKIEFIKIFNEAHAPSLVNMTSLIALFRFNDFRSCS